MTKTKNLDMTIGPIFKNLFLFCFPLALSGLLQTLFNTADLIVVGQFSSTPEESLASVSSNGALYALIVTLSNGLAVGVNVVIAQAIGAKDTERAQNALHTALLLPLILGTFFGVLGFSVSRPLLVLMNTDPVILDKATLYLQIIFLGFPASLLYNFGSAILRAKGDTRRPLIFLIISGVLNVLLNIVLILCGLDVAGVAIATVASSLVSAICVLTLLAKEQGPCNFSIKKLRICKAELGDIIKVGLPSGLLSASFSLSAVIIQSSFNTYALSVSPDYAYAVVAGNSTSGNIEGIMLSFLASIPQAVSSFVAQNFGAKNFVRIKKIFFDAIILGLVFWLVLSSLTLIFSRQLVELYITNPSSTEGSIMVENAVRRLFILVPFYILSVVQDIIVSTLRSMNHTVVPSIVSLFFVTVFRVLWCLFVFPFFNTLEVFYLSHHVSWLCVILINGLILIVVYNKLVKQKLNTPNDEGKEDLPASESVDLGLVESATTLECDEKEQTVDKISDDESASPTATDKI